MSDLGRFFTTMINKLRVVVTKTFFMIMFYTESWMSYVSRVKKHAIHSSDTTSSSDEERFERRKSKSMTRARNR